MFERGKEDELDRGEKDDQGRLSIESPANRQRVMSDRRDVGRRWVYEMREEYEWSLEDGVGVQIFWWKIFWISARGRNPPWWLRQFCLQPFPTLRGKQLSVFASLRQFLKALRV